MHTAVVDIALQLTIALIIVRVRRVPAAPVAGGESWVKGWENRLTFLVWLFVELRAARLVQPRREHARHAST